jgi:hypothetical protein
MNYFIKIMCKNKSIFPAILVSILFFSCSSSVSDRYEKEEKEKEIKETPRTELAPESFEEDFDLTPYRTKIEIEPDQNIKNDNKLSDLDIWYEYSENEYDTLPNSKKIISQADGYRVEVQALDNLEDAESLKTEIYFKTNQQNVYITFDPPFYKVKVGDYLNNSDANALSFKLNQMGYKDSRVVNETINIFE